MRPRRYVLMITAPILATSLLLLGLGVAAAWYVHRLNQEVSDVLARNLDCTVASERLVLGIRDVRIEMHRFIDSGDQRTLQAVVALRQTTSQRLSDAEQTGTTDAIRDLVARTRRSHDRFFAEFAIVTQDMPPATRQQKVRELMRSITFDVLSPAEQLLERTQEAARHHTERNEAIADSVGLGLLVLGACGASGGLMAGFAIARGIAKRIEQSEREATRSEQLAAVGQLAAGLGHELRNPLTAMRVLIEAGREQATSGGGLDRRDLEVLEEEITRLEKLVESFLDFARPPQVEKTAIDAQSLLEQTIHVVGVPARQRGVTIHCQPPLQAVSIEADPVQMRQVLLNLLLNALDAAGDGGTVAVEVGQVSDLPDAVRAALKQDENLPHDNYSAIHISDNGPGVPNDMKERIFEPFVSSKETGMGLGLAVSRRIVQAHGGTIIVSDNPGGGARFTIWLPARR